MKVLHSPRHWIAVAVVLVVALLTWSLAHGQQRNDAAATFQGRPAMAGAQAGTGAMAGPPQGGVGIQGQDNAGVALRPPAGLRDMPQGTVPPSADSIAVNRAVRDEKDIVPSDRKVVPQRQKDADVVKRDRDPGVAKDQRSTVKKTKRAAKNVTKQTRHGVPTVDSTRTPG